MRQYKLARLENKYCYGSHSTQARLMVSSLRKKALGHGWNKTVNERIAKRLNRLNKM